MFNSANILNAANYESLCNYSFVPSHSRVGSPEMLYKPGNIFCKTDYINYLFEWLNRECKTQHNLITHHSDYPIDEARFNKKPKCIKKWYAINPTVSHPDLIAIPLGLKTHKEPFLEPQYKTEWFAFNIERLRQNKKENNIYCNWGVTNIERMYVIDKLKHAKVEFTHDDNKPFEQYIENMSRHKFVISPPGNGIDCHRTWEALYVGSIPIVIKNYIYENWTGLPILQVNDFSEITDSLLTNFMKKQFTLQKLHINYWHNRICTI